MCVHGSAQVPRSRSRTPGTCGPILFWRSQRDGAGFFFLETPDCACTSVKLTRLVFPSRAPCCALPPPNLFSLPPNRPSRVTWFSSPGMGGGRTGPALNLVEWFKLPSCAGSERAPTLDIDSKDGLAISLLPACRTEEKASARPPDKNPESLDSLGGERSQPTVRLNPRWSRASTRERGTHLVLGIAGNREPFTNQTMETVCSAACVGGRGDAHHASRRPVSEESKEKGRHRRLNVHPASAKVARTSLDPNSSPSSIGSPHVGPSHCYGKWPGNGRGQLDPT